MKWLTAAEGPLKDWIHVSVDGINYCVHTKKAEIVFESEDKADLSLLMNSDKHRKNLADRASIAQREENGWASERQESWSVSYAGKSLKFSWDGSLPKKAAAMTATASKRTAAESLDQMAQRKFNKPYSSLTPEEKAQVADEMHQSQNSVAPANPVPPSFAPMPMAPGASKNIGWFVASADDGPDADDKEPEKDKDEPVKKDDKKAPPFEKKDDSKDSKDDKKDEPKEKKEPKKDAPKEPKKDKAPKKDAPKKDGPSKSDEKKDIKMAEDALKELEELLSREEKEGEGGPHLEALRHAIEELKKFLGEEENELGMGPDDGIPMKIDLVPLPMDKGPKSNPPMPMKPPMPAPGPAPMPMASGWTEENTTGFTEGDSVWRKADVGVAAAVGLEPGRVVAIGGGKVIVDWGDDEVLAEESPADLVMAMEAADEGELFRAEDGSELSEVNEGTESSPEQVKADIEAVLARTSLKDLLNPNSSEGSNPNAIVHLGTEIEGEFVARGSDGRLLVRVAGEEFFVWPYEVRFINKEEN